VKGIPSLRSKRMSVMDGAGVRQVAKIDSWPDPRGAGYPEGVRVQMPSAEWWFIEDKQIENLIGMVRAYREHNGSS
jgi:hypothetical protein